MLLQDLVVRNYMGLTLSCPDHDVLLQYNEFQFSNSLCSIQNPMENKQSSLYERTLYSYSRLVMYMQRLHKCNCSTLKLFISI